MSESFNRASNEKKIMDTHKKQAGMKWLLCQFMIGLFI